ncbi:phytanoyl-CoA dioxygenase family protein [Sphingomonas sp.]|uniref:phytanoyl-CoA dioxygenase family protein n=1 Tax=Sphingomonas sp. TaxID=28214 RepID=UPI002D807AF9|nr:phytanoyl-CoA dioxygenase family protein [Sphingomonas sp.]HEU0043237.1 phytanoyl-CoA dioxygenase family protein [Sphingomonas sp.]
MDLKQHGAAQHDRAALCILDALAAALAGTNQGRPGVRLHGNSALRPLLAFDSPVGRIAAATLGEDAKPVRAVLFDKTPGTNWALGWHQDRTIAVRARHDLPGWGPWSLKAGIQHVEPPFALIEHMVTLRIHLDAVPADNAPLLIAPRSHQLGRLTEREIESVVARCGTAACLAGRGDVWAYATPIVHASAASSGHARRRVLQVDYASQPLPEPLDWLGI